jgi:hypothetical protein
MFDKLRYEIFPYLKVRAMFLWWTIRYGGAKNIPPELLAERMEKSIARMKQALQDALRALPDDATEEERQMLFDTIREHDEIERMYREGVRVGKQ